MKKLSEKKKKLEKSLDKKLGELVVSKEIQKFNENDLLVSYNFNSLYPSTQIDENSNWRKIETS